MSWDPTQPPNATALLSAPMRDNFAAIGQAALVNATAKAQTVPNLTLVVSAFDYVGATGVRGTYAGGTSPALAAPTTNPRIALLTFTPATTTFAWTYGAEAASPAPPAYPFGVIPIVEVYCRVGLASITNTDTGTNGYILRLAPRVGPFGNPLTGVGDLIIGATAGLPSRLAPATNGQILTLVSGTPAWAANAAMLNPMSAIGDLILGGAAGAPTRFAAVVAGQVLTSAGVNTAPVWSATPTLQGPNPSLSLNKSASGQQAVIYGQTAGVPRWAIGLGDTAAETGSNAGSNFAIFVWDDAGTYLGAPFTINRATNEIRTSGPLRIAMAYAALYIDKTASGQQAVIFGETGGLARWGLVLGDTAAETGGNVGSNFAIWNINDAGTYLGTPFAIDRATQEVQVNGPLRINPGGLPRQVAYGAPDSGGAGFRMVRVAN
jgi:hypothetical protein